MNFTISAVEKRAVFLRFLIVFTIAFLMGLVVFYLKLVPLARTDCLVYTFSISISIWLFIEISELCVFYTQMKRMQVTWQRLAAKLISIVFGFFIGLSIGDEYSSYSVFSILNDDPQRFSGLALLTLVLAVITANYFGYWRQSVATKHLLTESHLKLLFSQLEPHMLFNTMATLRALIEVDAPRAMHMIDALNNYLKATLKASRSNWHPLSEEFERSNDYLALMSIRMGNRLCYSLDCPTGLSTLLVPALLLQPLVENAIKHGLEPSIAGGKIHIQAQIINQLLHLTVSNTGLGTMNDTFSSEVSGYGLAHVRERLDNIYHNRAHLTTTQREGFSSSLVITLPIEEVQ